MLAETKWKLAAAHLDSGKIRPDRPGEGIMCRAGRACPWNKGLVKAMWAVMERGELSRADTDAKALLLAGKIMDRWQLDPGVYKQEIASTTAKRLQCKVVELRVLMEGVATCSVESSFWGDALTLPQGAAARVVKSTRPCRQPPAWFQDYAKELFPRDWQERVAYLAQPAER